MVKNFEHNLIKGRIAETIFEMMFRDTKKFTVLHFGYESTIPLLAQYRGMAVMQKVIDQVSNNPDFVLITENKEQVYFVEVKYRAHPMQKDLLEIATGLSRKYDLSWLFLISKTGFFFSPVNTVINKEGNVDSLSSKWIPGGIQRKYLKLADDFLWHHED